MIDAARASAIVIALAGCDRATVLADGSVGDQVLAYCPPVTLGMTLPCIADNASVQFVHGAIDTGDPGCGAVGGVVVSAPTGDACVLSGQSVEVMEFVIGVGSRALVLSSATTITIAAPIDVGSQNECPARAGAGSPTCMSSSGVGGTTVGGGGGGGSYQTAGGNGGAASGAPGGNAIAPRAVDVRGGCAGGYGAAPGGFSAVGGPGGGAFVAVARDPISISANVLAGGAGGQSGSAVADGAGGGGAGGAIVFAAPTITISSLPRFCANGGGGGGGGPAGGTASDACIGNNTVALGATGSQNGGNGATGLSAGETPSGISPSSGAGGGGGVGYIAVLHATFDLAAVDSSPPITFVP